MSTTPCLSEEELYEYAVLAGEGYFSKENENHLNQCSECQKSFQAIREFESNLQKLQPSTSQSTLPFKDNKIEKFTLIGKIGQGGMGQVYKAFDPDLERFVAIKLLKQDLSGDLEYRVRFAKEAKAIAQLSHPNIVHLYSYGIHENHLYMVMEYLEGFDLSNFPQYRANDPAWINIFKQTIMGLDFAHQKGFLHRDIKPSNIMVTYEQQVKLMDFGLVTSSTTPTHTTVSGTLLGTVAYMAPEIAKGERASQQSDIYSLGIVFYQCLTKKLPFSSDTPLGVIEKIKTEPLKEPGLINSDIPDYLNNIILKMCSKSLSIRYKSLEDVLVDLTQKITPQTDAIQKEKVTLEQDDVSSIIKLASQIEKAKGLKLGQSSFLQIASELNLPESSVKEAIKTHQHEKNKKINYSYKSKHLILAILISLLFTIFFISLTYLSLPSQLSAPMEGFELKRYPDTPYSGLFSAIIDYKGEIQFDKFRTLNTHFLLNEEDQIGNIPSEMVDLLYTKFSINKENKIHIQVKEGNTIYLILDKNDTVIAPFLNLNSWDKLLPTTTLIQKKVFLIYKKVFERDTFLTFSDIQNSSFMIASKNLVSKSYYNSLKTYQEISQSSHSPKLIFQENRYESRLYMPETENKAFTLSGQIKFAKLPDPTDPMRTISFFLREINSYQRYECTGFGMRVKRTLIEGKSVEKFAYPFEFKDTETEQWYDFTLISNKKIIDFQIGNQRGVIEGPLEIKGRNSIVLDGGHFKNLNLTF